MVSPPFTHCYFIEKDPRLVTQLRDSVASHPNASVFEGDCNNVIPEQVLPLVPQYAPSLAFLDPTGSQLHWVTVRALAAHRLGQRKMELLILYPYDMFIVRWLRLPSMEPALTAMLGGTHWKDELAKSTTLRENEMQKRQRFVKLYCEGLRSLGYRFVEALGPLYSERGRPLYHVIFASDHICRH